MASGDSGAGRVTPDAMSSALAELLFRTSGAGVGIVDRDLRYVRVNDALAAMNGRPAAAHVGLSIHDVIPGVASTLETLLRQVMETGEPIVDLPIGVEFPPGVHRQFLVGYYPVRDETGAITAVASVALEHAGGEASEREARAVAARETDRARVLRRIITSLNEATTIHQVASAVVEDAMAVLGADAGSLSLVVSDAEGRPVELESARTSGYDASVAARYPRFPVVAGRPLSEVVLRGRSVFVGTPEDWTAEWSTAPEDLRALGFHSFAAVPVRIADRVVAALSFSFRVQREFDDSLRVFLATLGEQCALALERVRLHEASAAAAARRQEATAFLAEASRQLTASLDYQQTIRAVAQAAVPALGDWCAVSLIENPEARAWPPKLERVAIVHHDPAKVALAEELTTRYPIDWNANTGVPQVLRTGQPAFVPHISDQLLTALARDEDHLALLRALSFSAVIIVPLIARNVTLGTLTLVMTESGRRYDAEDLALAQDLAQRQAMAVDNARLFQEAERARGEAEAANQAKAEFLAVMSHELRTPLNAISGYVQLLDMGIHGPVTDEQRVALERIHRSGVHLTGIINEVLNFARLESATVTYDIRPTRAAEVIAEVVPLLEPQRVAKGLTLDTRIPEGAAGDVCILADRDKLQQVLLNLLSNAVKFTGAPGRVTVELDPGDGSDGNVAIRVADTGIGIPESKLESIFEPFVQVDRSRNNPSEGTGLGLAISRGLARGMGGELSVESVLGAGSVFTLRLRRADA